MSLEFNEEKVEDAIFTETLKLPVKPACFFSAALPYRKATKPNLQACHAILQHKEN